MALFDDWQAIVVVMSLAGGIVASFFKEQLLKQKAQSDETIARMQDMAAVEKMVASCIDELDARLSNMQTKFDIFWTVIEQQLPKILIRPTHLRMDELLEKMSDGKLNSEECKELKDGLRQEIDAGLHRTDANRALAYVFLLARLESRLIGVQKKW